MTDALPIADFALKIIYAVVGVGIAVFAAGKAWATISGMVGSLAALHRRFSEIEVAIKTRDTVVDGQFVAIRLDIARLQTWKQTLRFKAPAGEVPIFKDSE